MESQSPSTSYPISIGSIFRDWSDLKLVIEEWAITAQFAFRVRLKDYNRADYVCRIPESCSWRVFASRNQDSKIQVKIIQPRHNCIGRGDTPREVHNSQAWLRRTVPKHLFVTRQTTTREITDILRIQYGVKVNTEAARLAKASLLNDRIEHQQQQYHQIPEYLQLLHSKAPGLHSSLYTIPDPVNKSISHFHRVFLCPAQSRSSFLHMRRFVAVDGTFLKAKFIQTLLLAVGIDGDGRILLLAWAVVESENTSSWTWFLENLKTAIPEVLSTTLISDRDKGLMAADAVLGPNVNRAICCYHLHKNFKRFRDVESYFWPLANAKSQPEFDILMQQLAEQNAAAADYLSKIDKTLWVTAFFGGRLYGHKTSNIVESMNHVLRPQRELPILEMLNDIWHLTMNTRYERYLATSSQVGIDLHSDFALQKLIISRNWSRHNTVRISDQYRAEVSQANDHTYIVDLSRKFCTCGHFQENDIPCGHAYSFILALHQSPRDYLPHMFTISTLKDTYCNNFPPISLKDLPNSSGPSQGGGLGVPYYTNCAPPTKLCAAQGRPQKKRMIRGSHKRQIAQGQARLNLENPPPEKGKGSQQCRGCGRWGHNRRTCPGLDSHL